MRDELFATGFAALYLLLVRDILVLSYKLIRFTVNKIRS